MRAVDCKERAYVGPSELDGRGSDEDAGNTAAGMGIRGDCSLWVALKQPVEVGRDLAE